MTDPDIIKLFFERSEEAISQTENKYGAYCRSVAMRILRDSRDAEEAASDAMLAAWRSIPPNSPECLSAYVAKLCRNAAISMVRKNAAAKRGGGGYDAALDELGEIAGSSSPEAEAESQELAGTINRFLEGLPKRNRRIFVQRYWYLMTEEEIAQDALMTAGAVKMQLSRMRTKLKEQLLKEGMYHG